MRDKGTIRQKLDIQQHSERLKKLLSRKVPQQDDWVYLREILDCKYEGLQSGALKVLGAWGGKAAKALLRDFLISAFEREHGWAIRGVAIRALEPLVEPSDAQWLLDLCFSHSVLVDRHEVLNLFGRLTPETTRNYLLPKLRSAERVERRAAARAVMAIQFPDQDALLAPLLKDHDTRVMETATAGIAQHKDRRL